MNVSISNAAVSVASVSPRSVSRIFTIFTLVLFAAGSAVFAIPDRDPCSWIRPLEAGQVQTTDAHSSEDVFAIEVSEPGWLALQVESTQTAQRGAAWVELLGSPCSGDKSRIAAVGSFLDHGLVEVTEPGTVYLKTGTVESNASGGAWLRLATHLFPTSDRMPWRKEGESGSDTEEDDDEVLPFQSPGGNCVTQAFTAPNQSRDPWSKEGESGSDTEEDDDEVLPFQSPGRDCVTQAYAAPHQNRSPWSKEGESGSDTEEDDDEVLPFVGPGGRSFFQCGSAEPMNDFRACAAHVGPDHRIVGRIDSDAGLDRDYYAFTLHKLDQVSLIGTGETELVGSLLDAHGRELITHGRHETGFVLNATLAEGRYYLRVEGFGEGEYRVDFGE